MAYTLNQHAGGTVSTDRGVYVQPFPPTGTPQQMPQESRDFHPVWSPKGTELIYLATSGKFSVVSFQTRPSLMFGRPTALPITVRHERLSGDVRDFDVMPDGRLLLTTQGDDSAPGDTIPQFRIFLNWFEELKARVPVK
jgi:hypothetical protein